MVDDRDELVILTDEDFELDEGERGWSDPIKNAAGRLRAVKLDPAIVEVQMGKFVAMVGRLFQQANAQVPLDSGLTLEEVELAVKINGKALNRIRGLMSRSTPNQSPLNPIAQLPIIVPLTKLPRTHKSNHLRCGLFGPSKSYDFGGL